MKLEALRGRGRGDYIASRDFEDIVVLLDRRAELVEELRAASDDLRRYVSAEAQRLLGEPRLLDGIAATLSPDDASQERAALVVVPALRALAEPS